jgi:hypothetical protein
LRRFASDRSVVKLRNSATERAKPKDTASDLTHVRLGDAKEAKTVRVTEDGVLRRSPIRVSSLLDQVLNPLEKPLLCTSPFVTMSVGYPEQGVEVLGTRS